MVISALTAGTDSIRPGDPCAEIAGVYKTGDVVLISKFKDCLNSFPYNSTQAANILDTVSKTLSFYVYEEIAKQSPTPQLPSSVDLQDGLMSLKSRAWENDFSFHEALQRLTPSLNDGHTIYLSNCYNV